MNGSESEKALGAIFFDMKFRPTKSAVGRAPGGPLMSSSANGRDRTAECCRINARISE